MLQLALLESLGVLSHDELVDNVLNVAIHKRRKVVDSVVYAVVRNTALWVVVRTNLCRTVTCRYHCLSLRGYLVEVLRILEVEDTCTKLLKGLIEVLELRLLILALHDDARRYVGKTNSRVGGINRLTTRA